VGVQRYIWKELFIDFGLGYDHIIDSDGGGTNSFAAVYVGVGWRLMRRQPPFFPKMAR
jgi:hypothetical protein